MDISNLTKATSAAPVVTKVAGEPSSRHFAATEGNTLPGAGQNRVDAEYPSDTNPVSPTSPDELNELVNQANLTLQSRSSDLKFTIAEGTDISVVRIEDSETGELIRQFPSEEMVAIARALEATQQGMMFEEKA